jgi:general secretion pathway protein I
MKIKLSTLKKKSGFTLIECLVALFIVTIVLASASRAIGVISTDLRDTFVIEVATWVSENSYNQLKLSKIYPNVGSSSEDTSMAGMDFIVTQNVTTTQNPYFRKVEIVVAEKSTPEHSIFRTISFISQY